MTQQRERRRGGGRHTIWIVLLGLAVLVVGYFIVFTRTPEQGTRQADSLAASDQSEPPGANNDAVAIPSDRQ